MKKHVISMNMPNPFPGMAWNPKSIHTITKVTKTETFSKGIAVGNNGVLIHIILDESGSMHSCWDQTISAFNEWLETQQREEGEAFLTICKFNGSEINYVTEEQSIMEVEPLNRNTYHPIGGTNLLDAIGDNLETIDNILRSKRKKYRPGVITIVMTDGYENSSRNFSKSKISNMIKSREEKDWVFMFLGANVDAFAEGSSMGFRSSSTLQYNTDSMSHTMAALSNSTSRVRGAFASGLTGDMLVGSACYTESERAQAMTTDTNNINKKK